MTGRKSKKANKKQANRTRRFKQRGGSIKEKALNALKANNINLRNFMTELYQEKKTQTIDGVVFKVIKKQERYFDIFDLYLLAKPATGLFSTYEEIEKVDFGSGSLM
jgi:hypothetical protein